jgi:hypothetical protein
MYRAGDVRVQSVPDAAIVYPTDAVVRVTGAALMTVVQKVHARREIVSAGAA